MYWLMFAYYFGHTAPFIWCVALELMTLALGIEYAEIPVSRKSAAYVRLVAGSYGLGYTIIDNNGRFRYGMFLAPRLGLIGRITPPAEDQSTAHIWAFRAGAIDALMMRDPTATLQTTRTYSPDSTYLSQVRVPLRPLNWQRIAMDIILRACRQCDCSPHSDAIVCLVTGAPGLGKSTLALTLAREIDGTSEYVVRYPKMQKLTAIYGHRRTIGIIDEVDEIISGVTNDKRAATVTKAEWNFLLDHVHSVSKGPIIIMTSNNTIDELREKAGEHADAMLRPGRVDIILHVDADGYLTEVRSYTHVCT